MGRLLDRRFLLILRFWAGSGVSVGILHGTRWEGKGVDTRDESRIYFYFAERSPVGSLTSSTCRGTSGRVVLPARLISPGWIKDCAMSLSDGAVVKRHELKIRLGNQVASAKDMAVECFRNRAAQAEVGLSKWVSWTCSLVLFVLMQAMTTSPPKYRWTAATLEHAQSGS